MYKTGHAFNYLLHKESVANDVINVSLFAYDEITLKTYVNKRKQDIDKICLGIKKVRDDTIHKGIFKQEVEQAWCGGLSEAIAINGVH